jgi:peptidyl-dipeptidase Dcp
VRTFLILGAIIMGLAASSCATGPTGPTGPEATANPFFEDWTALPFQAPPFDRIKTEDFTPAFERGMAEHAAEIVAIAGNPAPPTFANTIEAMELSGQTLNRVSSVFFNLTGSNTDEALQAIELNMAPRLSRHNSEINLNPALFARIDALYQRRTELGLAPDQLRLLERYHLDFVRAGARLDEAGRTRLGAVDEQISTLSTQFDQNLLADTAAWTMTLTGDADLAGLPDALRSAALQAGADLGHPNTYVITLQRSSVEPFLQYSTRRDLRERAFRAWAARGDNGNQWDNRVIIRQLLTLRTERAHLLGYPNYASYALDDRMAKTPEAAYALMRRVWAPAVARAEEERADYQRMIDAEHGRFRLQAWDWRFYAERVREQRYDIDENEVRPYLQFERILEGAFYTANRLFGVTFTERHDIPVYHPDVRVYEVKNAAGETIGLYLCDPFMRPSKQSGAWMNSFQVQQRFGGRRLPIIVNVWNYAKPAEGQPALISWDDAETIFHEFGHALHGLLSNVNYPMQSGTNVARDYVEFPSQVMEHWFAERDTLRRFAVNAQGQPMPDALIERLHAAQTFNQGFATVEFLSSSLIDMDLHMQNAIPPNFDVDAFEEAELERLNQPREIIPRHRPTHFSHIFAGGYAAGYYGYLWAEVLDADAFEAFKETGDPFNPELAHRFLDYVFSAGDLRDPAEAYRLFRGHDPDPSALMRLRGFAPPR